MRSNQLTLIFGAALICVASGLTTVTPRTTTRRSTAVSTLPPISIRPWPCSPPAVCARTSPRVCGRTPKGDCQRFNNICDLIQANRLGNPAGIRHTRDIDCRTVRAVGAAHRRACWVACPARPRACRRTPPRQEICVRSRNNRECKILANTCQLRNQNCNSQPRNNWLRTDKRRCAGMQLGDKQRPCINLPTTTRHPISRRTTTPRPTTLDA
ncbi:uncharacterized protein LOC117580982 [Drosophila guanche]|uniref:Kazal-like domain-containing protein n=1 Tax=Drosophila guanche TaxID=7266 RepID=A0A3B0JZR8_DROGU|nr:uncharacterized protein LOC117580982 [Drosophila guanche]SPP78856.1 Hypothetical predicted protein [Drosophila guanche]